MEDPLAMNTLSLAFKSLNEKDTERHASLGWGGGESGRNAFEAENQYRKIGKGFVLEKMSEP